jgi:uncharacterized phage protein (TIGR02218 family)
MRPVPAALQAKLDSGVTTLCRCYALTRRDSTVQGFTDHDRDLTVAGVPHKAAAGLAASEAVGRFGLSVAGMEIAGALSDETILEADLARGLYDAADVVVRLVDWTDPTLHVVIATGSIGEVRREGNAFVAEMRGLAHRLAQERGRRYTRLCDADLGDARCGVDLMPAAFRRTGTVATLLDATTFMASGLTGLDDGWFTAGRLTFAGGANKGQSVEIKEHRVEAGGVRLSLWQTMPDPVAPGDTFTVTAGCDKRAETCTAKFANIVNFRGFPAMPGDDFVARYVIPGEPGHDGAPRR